MFCYFNYFIQRIWLNYVHDLSSRSRSYCRRNAVDFFCSQRCNKLGIESDSYGYSVWYETEEEDAVMIIILICWLPVRFSDLQKVLVNSLPRFFICCWFAYLDSPLRGGLGNYNQITGTVNIFIKHLLLLLTILLLLLCVVHSEWGLDINLIQGNIMHLFFSSHILCNCCTSSPGQWLIMNNNKV